MVPNPFTYGNPISDPARFFGRQREVEQVFSRLRNVESESSSLVGERRIGKTSLLNHIAHPAVRRQHSLDPQQYVFVYVDLQIVDKSTTPARLWQRLLRLMGRQWQDAEIKGLIDELRTENSIDNFALTDLFDSVDQKGQHVVLLLDEFENVTENANFGPDFFYGLRSLAIHHNLSLVTSSRRELIELCHSEAIRSSPFFNIFANINVRLFSEADARNLIEQSLAGTGIRFSEEEVNTLLRVAGTHPYFLQAGCCLLFDAYSGEAQPGRLKTVLRQFRDEAAPHLADYWYNSDDHEKIVLTALALMEQRAQADGRGSSLEQLKELYTRSDQILAHLEKRGMVLLKGDSYALFNSAFANWILSEISSTLRDQGSYQEWLNTHHGGLDHLSGRAKSEIGEILPRVNAKYRGLVLSWATDPRNLMVMVELLRTALGH